MPRKGWSTLETPNGWFQVIRGPRPPSVRWPNAKSFCAWDEAEVHSTKGQVASGATQGHPRGGVGKCQEACFWIGGCYFCHDCQWHRRDVFRGDLAKAKRNAQEPSLSIQLKGAMEFVERARKRLAAHDAQRAVLEKELVDGETKGATSGGRSFCGASHKACRVGCRGLSVEGETCNDGGRTSTFEGGTERMSDEAPSIAGIPPMPHHAEEVEQWLIDRNCELRSALHYQDTHMIAHIGALIAKGASKLSTVEPTEGQSRSSHGRPHFRGRRKEEVYRSQSVPFHGGKPCVVRSSRYGLRGVRIGEASHPGSRLLRRYRGSKGGVVVSSDDDAPLLCQDLRNVVPRMEGSVSVSDIVQTIPDSTVSRESTQDPVGSTVPANSAELEEAGLKSPPASLPLSVFPTARDEDESTMFDVHVSPTRDRSDNGSRRFCRTCFQTVAVDQPRCTSSTRIWKRGSS